MKVSVRPEDLLFGVIPGVQLYAQFTRAFLSFYNASEDGEEQEIKKEVSIGHVFRDMSGENYIVAGVNFHFDNDLSTLKEDPLVEQGRLTAHSSTSLSFMPLNNFSDPLPLYRVDRVTIMAIHIGSKGNGARKHADLGRHPKEFDLSNLTAVGQNTSSDAVNGEAQLLRNRMKDPEDVLGKCFIGCEDPA